jgi:hypothetical protein
MTCPRCQQENPPQAKFCLECATPLASRCTNCGPRLPAGAKFCFECATPVSAPGSSPRALDRGVTETELKWLITHVAFYAGPGAVNGGRVAIEVFGPKQRWFERRRSHGRRARHI